MRTSSAVFCRYDFLRLAKTDIQLLRLHGSSQDVKYDSLPLIAASESSIVSSTCLGCLFVWLVVSKVGSSISHENGKFSLVKGVEDISIAES